ncbi:MAG: GNAT family N-acetyltransferase [Betaproteobacteria bacterium]
MIYRFPPSRRKGGESAMLRAFASPCGVYYWSWQLQQQSQDHLAGDGMSIREINAASATEVALVAQRMRQTLIEVEGEAVGTALYSLEWLQQRVRWHLDPDTCTGAVFLAVGKDEKILGHTIVRVELEDPNRRFGLFATTYIEPAVRRQTVASRLLIHGEQWMKRLLLSETATWTSGTNLKLIRLYAKHGYVVTQNHTHETTGTLMVKLTKAFASD